MNRRKFFNFLGAAVIGTVVSLKLPETIAPLNNLVKSISPKIGFVELEEAYRSHCFGAKEPNFIFVNQKTFDYLYDMFVSTLGENYPPLTPEGFAKFHNAYLVPVSKTVYEDEIHFSGDIEELRTTGRVVIDQDGRIFGFGRGWLNSYSWSKRNGIPITIEEARKFKTY